MKERPLRRQKWRGQVGEHRAGMQDQQLRRPPPGLTRGAFESSWGGAVGAKARPEEVHRRGEMMGLWLLGRYRLKD